MRNKTFGSLQYFYKKFNLRKKCRAGMRTISFGEVSGIFLRLCDIEVIRVNAGCWAWVRTLNWISILSRMSGVLHNYSHIHQSRIWNCSHFHIRWKTWIEFPACKYERKGVWAIEQLALSQERLWYPPLFALNCRLEVITWLALFTDRYAI